MGAGDPRELARMLTQGPPAAALVHARTLPERRAASVPLPAWTDPEVVAALLAEGITAAWPHQVAFAEALRAGTHTVIATGTASGKSLGYLLPALTDIVTGAGVPGGRGATVLYLAPTKALAADQLARLERLAAPGVRAATYDGDTPRAERAWIRRHANYVLTNPDMLHHGILPGHNRWAAFWRGLAYVVVDECHAYRGLLGSHVAAVLRRLRRVAAHHQARPTFALASATVAEPAAHAGALLGLPVTAVTKDRSPRPAQSWVFLDPGLNREKPDGHPLRVTSDATVAGSGGADAGPGALAAAGHALATLVAGGVQTVAFTRSRLGAEVLAARARRELDALAPELAGRVAAYRGGYLPEDRRALEDELRSGRLRGLAATSALELGVDVGGLDAVVLAGWPGTRSALWQRAGRAGRAGRSSLVVLVAEQDPLDAYLVHHPEAVFGAGIEASVLDPDNPHVLGPHLAAAAAELALTEADTAVFGAGTPALIGALVAARLLRRRPRGWYWTRQERPTDHLSLRGSQESVRIVERDTGRVLGTVDAPRADAVVHRGAVYLHQQQAYVVTALDLDEGTAAVVAGDPGWTTQARTVSAFDLVEVHEQVTSGSVAVAFGTVTVRSRVTSFRRRAPGGAVLGEHPLDLPERTLTTKAVWWTATPVALAAGGVADRAVPGAAHAAEHAAIGMLPLVATVDRWDVGGVSTACHPDTGLPTILVYDGHPGGAGFAERGFASRRGWLAGTREAIARCGCAAGCPACVQSPKCGNGNDPLDKAGAVRLLDVVLGAWGHDAGGGPGGGN